MSAYELVDWFRLVVPRINVSDLHRLLASVERLHPPALQELVQHLDVQQASLWDALDVTSDLRRVAK